uniref:Transcription initiation factor IIF subunit alpha n=1 Tax=Spongospora subterranea TaxID=70186 RepID=A0A0H5QFT2_9EUKA|eukprot:CRZ00913.1 hypothetical protein [Spongospora subterranea]
MSSIPIYRNSSETQLAIVRMEPGISVSMKGTTVAGASVDSMARRSNGKKVKNFILNDRKHKRVYRAQPENVQTRSKYVVFQQKGRAIFYTEVELFKANLETKSADPSAVEEAEKAEQLRHDSAMARMQRSRSRISNFLMKNDKTDDDQAPAVRVPRQKTVRQAQHEFGLGDEDRDLDFEDEFDDDDEVKITVDTTNDTQNPDQADQDEDLTAAGKKIAQILSKSEDLDEFSGSEEDEMLASDSDEDVADDNPSPTEVPSSRKRTAEAAVEISVAKRVCSSVSSVPPSAKPVDAFVTEEDVREQFRTHGRLTVKSLARIMEDTWKYKGASARKELFAIVQRICTYQADPNRPGVKYLVLKP